MRDRGARGYCAQLIFQITFLCEGLGTKSGSAVWMKLWLVLRRAQTSTLASRYTVDDLSLLEARRSKSEEQRW